MKRKLYLLAVGLCACGLLAAPPTVINRTGRPASPTMAQFANGGPFEIYWQAVPTSLSDVATVDTHLLSVTVSNTTGGALTFTFQTKDASPLALPLSGSIPANTAVNFNIPAGLLSKGGMSVQASSTGLLYSLVWTN
jgi:hypothetical protein